ncbi:ribosomal protein L7/L12 [Paractinoplanes atraurantiacus]|uniref:Ribosomal protein L7/L12 C-terminal domain-containing protein n=1 Tax=Paractinoplanes atraurantiacus TaxID=1036182 RepID=A0A285J0R7_9ACTN|nr:ribosomal protein L7/L12 [Actinoplanes atraurantiacus]SNY53792.1 Ribosomal protein L7/L12 C-terminal domain-containing protein [Actinoplanes atraurantiacus]
MEILLSAALVILAVFLVSTRSRSSSREAAIERKLDLVMRHLGIEDPAADSPDVLGPLMQGQKIQAIKVYREQTGASLAEAKAAVEQIARNKGL